MHGSALRQVLDSLPTASRVAWERGLLAVMVITLALAGGAPRPEAALGLGALLLLLTPAAGGMLMAVVLFPVG